MAAVAAVKVMNTYPDEILIKAHREGKFIESGVNSYTIIERERAAQAGRNRTRWVGHYTF